VDFNENQLAVEEHSRPLGEKYRGDGKLDVERQTIFFDVTGMTLQGANKITITNHASPTTPFYFDGAILINFYPSAEEHQYWVYHGVEYLEKKDRNDAEYKLALNGLQNPVKSEATLYTVYNNFEQEHDALFFNEKLLRDKDATYLAAEDGFGSYTLSGSHMIAKRFEVTDYLQASNTVTFTMDRYQQDESIETYQYERNPIYPSIAVLDVKLPEKEKAVVLANSIDFERASDFVHYIESKNMRVVHATADNFDKYLGEKFIVILGGPDAPEGVGDLIKKYDLIDIDDADYVRKGGNKQKFKVVDKWGKGQTLWIFAGSDRERTKSVHLEHRAFVLQEMADSKTEIEEPVEEEVDPCEPVPETPFTHISKFEDPKKRGEVYICNVVFSKGKNYWEVTFHNRGEDEIDLAGYILLDRSDNSFYLKGRFIDSEGYLILDSKDVSETNFRLRPERGKIFLIDKSDDIIDKVSWDLLS
jgi:hypothetical protein